MEEWDTTLDQSFVPPLVPECAVHKSNVLSHRTRICRGSGSAKLDVPQAACKVSRGVQQPVGVALLLLDFTEEQPW